MNRRDEIRKRLDGEQGDPHALMADVRDLLAVATQADLLHRVIRGYKCQPGDGPYEEAVDLLGRELARLDGGKP